MEHESTKESKLSTPQAILAGAVIIAVAIFLVKMPARPTTTQNTPSDTTAGPTADKYANMILGTKSKITIPAVSATEHVRGATNPKSPSLNILILNVHFAVSSTAQCNLS